MHLLRLSALSSLTMVLLAGATVANAADDPCSGYKWDVTQEHALFTRTPEPITAGHDLASAPTVKTGQLYEVALSSQDGVKFALPPGKKGLSDGAFAGLVHFQVPTAGAYRVSLDQGFWIDVISNQKFIDSTDFTGSHTCPGPRKIVVYNLPAGRDLVLQLSAATQDHVRVTLTPVPAK